MTRVSSPAGSKSTVPISVAWRLVWLLASAALAFLAYRALLLGYVLSEHFEGRKLGGVMEGDWFFLFGLLGLVIAGFLAIRTLLWALTGKRRQSR